MILACLWISDILENRRITAIRMFNRTKIDLEPLNAKIVALETACADLKRDRRALDLEFTELYDKVSHQMSRMAKRYTSAAKANGAQPEEELEPGQFDHLDPVSRSIMLRRGGVGRGK